MPQAELQVWASYVNENGPLNPSLRIEAAIARAVAPFIKGSKARDFMPWPREPEPEATFDGLGTLFTNLAAQSAASKQGAKRRKRKG